MKETDHSSLLAIHPLSYKGEQVLQNLWPAFLKALRTLLLQVGTEAPGSTAEVWLIRYEEPFDALSTFFESLGSLKKQHWQDKWGAVPIQVILHLHRKKDPPVEFGEGTAPAWGVVQQEILHVTRGVKLQWQQLFAGKKLPAHQFDDAGDGLFRLTFSGDLSGLKRERLFTGRFLAAKGTSSECFYCGLSNHAPAHCPSKQLTIDTRGLNLVGYLPLADIDRLFKRVMAEQKKMAELLAANIDAGQIRNDPALQVYVAYFDMYLIYQPRFLAYSAFSVFSSWDGGGKPDRIKVDSRNLHTGFDCLRVGQYRQAFDFMKAESQALGGKQFYATLGHAFIALEHGRMGDMAHFLQMANSTASTEKEKIYISLLFARFQRLTGHPWKAEQIVGAIAKLYVDCPEILYALIQTKIHEGLGQQQMQLLRKLAAEDRRYFMTALMDPALSSADSMVENVLSGLLELKNREAGESLAEAREAWDQIRSWFGGEEDDALRTNLSALSTLEEQFLRHGVYDVLEVAERAKTLGMAGPRLREERLDELNIQVDAAALAWADYNTFWQEYPYQSFFRNFQRILASGKRKFVEARSIAGENLATARARLNAGREQVELLAALIDRMAKLKIALDTLAMFVKKLLLLELVFSALAFVSLPLIIFGLSGLLDPGIIRLVEDPQTQRGGMAVITLFLAPLIALTLTIRSMSER